MSGEQVLVWGEGDELDALPEQLAARDGFAVSRANGEPPWDDDIDCVVTPPAEERVEAVRGNHDVPVVAFGEADGDAVGALLAAGATDVVQADGSEGREVLAERVAAALRGDGSTAAPGADSEPVHPGRERDENRAGGTETSGTEAGGTDADRTDAVPTDADGIGSRRYAEILAALDDGVYALDPHRRCTYVNEEMTALSGYSEEELLGSDPGLLLEERATARVEREIARRWRETEGSVDVTARTTIRRKDGERVPCELLVTALADDDGAFTGTVGVVRDVSERERRQELLTRLQETSRSLMQAPSRETVARIVVDAARRTLGFDIAVFRLYDPEERTLVPVASTSATTDVMAERPAYDLNEGPAGEVFVSGESAIYDDVRTYDDEHDRSPVRSVMYFPIGVHGVLSIATTEVAAFDDADEQIATLLATNAAAACNRAKREREVRDARERIATILERINGLVEDTIEVLVQATTREEVESGVCEQLAAAEPYVHAWIARPDVREEVLVASEWAGHAPIDVQGVELSAGSDGPGVTAFEDGESVVLDADELDAGAARPPAGGGRPPATPASRA